MGAIDALTTVPSVVLDPGNAGFAQEVFGGMTTVSMGFTRGSDTVLKHGEPAFLDSVTHWQYRFGLTQVLTANLAARYHAPLSVAVGAILALWAVAGLAVIGGHGVLSRLPTRPLRLVTGSVLSVLAVLGLVAAFR